MAFDAHIREISHEGGMLAPFTGDAPRLGQVMQLPGGKWVGKVDSVIGEVSAAVVHVTPFRDVEVELLIGQPLEVAPPKERRDDRRGRRDNREKSHVKDGDWTCPKCQNHNFAWRDKCNRCEVLKSEVVGKNQGGDGVEASVTSRTIVVETEEVVGRSIPKWRRSPGQSWWRPTWSSVDTEVAVVARTIVVETDVEAAVDTEVADIARTIVVVAEEMEVSAEMTEAEDARVIANNDRVMTGLRAENTKVAMIANQSGGTHVDPAGGARKARVKPSALKSHAEYSFDGSGETEL